jgi:hypothetical protein
MKQTNRHLWLYLPQYLLKLQIIQTKFVEEIKSHILCSVTFLSKNHSVYDKMWKNIVDRSNTAHAHYTQDTYG